MHSRSILFVGVILISLLSLHEAYAFLPLTPGTIIIQNTTIIGKQGSYNQTQANNVAINSNGQKLNFINGSGNPIIITNSPAKQQVNITINGGGGGGGVTSLNALVGALTIACVSGNTTCTTSGGNTITINTAWNIVTTGLAAQTITKALTINNLILGGNANVGANALTNAGHQSTLPLTSGVLCQANMTGTCGTGGGGITSINSQIGPAYNLLGSFANITITNSTNKGQINLGSSVIISTGATQEVVKKFIVDMLFLNGNENASNNKITNLGLPTQPTDAARENTIGNNTLSPYGNPANNNVLTYQTSNTTAIWAIPQVPDSIVVYTYLTGIGNFTSPVSATVSSTG